MEQIIDTVHSHTLAVELAARLLETGILEPMDLLEKLKEEKTSLDADDKIGITKDGQSRKATYYDHIHTLFSLYQLAGDEQDIMRSMAFVPTTGISSRVFAGWLMMSEYEYHQRSGGKGSYRQSPVIRLPCIDDSRK